ncbi:hypothetical protein ACFQ3Z_08700 [Streptomyces nogalater]
MKSWEAQELKSSGSTIKVTAVPALHGPDGVDRGADGEVTGFVLSGKGSPPPTSPVTTPRSRSPSRSATGSRRTSEPSTRPSSSPAPPALPRSSTTRR